MTPKPTRHLYVDFSNLLYEGKHVMGRLASKREAPWHCNFNGLLDVLVGDAKRGRCHLVTSDPFGAQEHAQAAGFEVETYPRAFNRKEKCVDTHLAVEAMRDAFGGLRIPGQDTFVLVSGDLDQLPVARALRAEGFTVINAFWAHSARGLRDVCDVFVSLDEHREKITWDPKELILARSKSAQLVCADSTSEDC